MTNKAFLFISLAIAAAVALIASFLVPIHNEGVPVGILASWLAWFVIGVIMVAGAFIHMDINPFRKSDSD